MAVMTNKEATALSYNNDFRKYVISGIVEIATEVLEEDPAGLESIVSSKRVSLAQRVTNDFDGEIKAFAINLAIQENLNKDITINSTSGEVEWAGGGDFSGAINTYIENVWNFVAGVSYSDENP